MNSQLKTKNIALQIEDNAISLERIRQILAIRKERASQYRNARTTLIEDRLIDASLFDNEFDASNKIFHRFFKI